MRPNLFIVTEATGIDAMSFCNGILYATREEAEAVQKKMEEENADNEDWHSEGHIMILPPGMTLIKSDHLEQLVQLAEACTGGSDEHQEHVEAIAAGKEALP